jgi:hypothetical protein
MWSSGPYSWLPKTGVAGAAARHKAVYRELDRQCRVELDVVGDLRRSDAEDPADGRARQDTALAHPVIDGAVGGDHVERDLVDAGVPAGILGEMGLATVSVGLVLLAFRPGHAAIPEMAWWMAICGVGFGFFQSPKNCTILASTPPHRAGSASSILAAARLVGQTVAHGDSEPLSGRRLRRHMDALLSH